MSEERKSASAKGFTIHMALRKLTAMVVVARMTRKATSM